LTLPVVDKKEASGCVKYYINADALWLSPNRGP
jgi:hypothetical protein